MNEQQGEHATMATENKIFDLGRDAIWYDPDGLNIAIAIEYLESPSRQGGVCIETSWATYVDESGKAVEETTLKKVKEELIKEYAEEGMFVRFRESSTPVTQEDRENFLDEVRPLIEARKSK